MDPETRVCPFCGHPPGGGVFCAACGRNLADVQRLPTRAGWEADAAAQPAGAADAPSAGEATAERCTVATAAFLAAMHAAGDPGAQKTQMAGRGRFGTTPHVHGWVLRAVDREDFEEPIRNEPGLFLTVDGAFHRLDSEVRGWGQRTFPVYHPIVAAEPMPMPVDERLVDDLAAVLQANGVAAAPDGAR